MDTPARPPRSPVLRALLIAAAGAATIAGVLGASKVALLDTTAFVERHRAVVEDVVQNQLGRRLSFGQVEAVLFPHFMAVIHDVELEDASPGARPQVVLPRVEVRFDVGRALTTFGQVLEVEAVVVEGGKVRVVRDAAGRVDLLEVLKRLPPPEMALMRAGVVRTLRVQGVQVELVDVTLNRHAVLNDVRLESNDLALGRPFDARASFTSPESGALVSATVHVDLVPLDFGLWPLPTGTAHLEVSGFDLDTLTQAWALPALVTQGAVDATVDVVSSGTGTLTADVRARGDVAFVGDAAAPGPVTVDGTLAVDLVNGTLHVERLLVDAAGLTAQATLDADAASSVVVDALQIDVQATDLARLQRIAQVATGAGPTMIDVDGAGRISVRMADERLDADLDLDDATVKIGEAWQKHAGETARLRFDGARAPDGIDGFAKAELPRGARVTGAIAFVPMGGDVMLIDARTSSVPLVEVLRQSPILHDVLGGEQRGGDVVISMKATYGRTETDTALHLQGRRMNVVQDTTTLLGDASADLRIVTNAGGLALSVRSDMTKMAIVTRDGATGERLFFKEAMVPARLEASLREAGGPGAIGRALKDADQSPKAAAARGSWMVGDQLAPRWRSIFGGLDGRLLITAGAMTISELALQDVFVHADLRRGLFMLSPATVSVLGGSLSLTGSTVDVRGERPRYALQLDAEQIDLQPLLGLSDLLRGTADGRVSMQVAVQSGGLSLSSIIASLDGPISVTTQDVRIVAPAVVAMIGRLLMQQIVTVPGFDGGKLVPDSATLIVKDGTIDLMLLPERIQLAKPITIATSLGDLVIEGRAGVDATIDLTARLGLTYAPLVNALGEPSGTTVPVDMQIAGTWQEPVVQGTLAAELLERLRTRASAATQEVVASAEQTVDGMFKHWLREVDEAVAKAKHALGNDPRR